jgi:hypothetical protein
MKRTQYKYGTVQLYSDLFLNDKNTGLSVSFTETLRITGFLVFVHCLVF